MSRIDAADRTLFRIPLIDHPVTINEWHAIVIGWIGVLLGALVGVTPRGSLASEFALAVTVLVALYAVFGAPICRSLCHYTDAYQRSIGMKTVRHEPWYFLVSLVGTFLGGVLVFGIVL